MHNIKIVGWEKPKVASGGMITDPMGQWAHPGKNTRIPGNNITMQGVPYPVLAKASNGQQQMMYPGQDYSFPGASHVDEYPMMRNGGRVLPKAQTGLITNLNTPTRGDSLFLLNNNKIINNLLDSGKYNWMIGKDDNISSKKNIKPKDWKKIFEQKKEFFDISIPNEVLVQAKRKGKLSDYKKEKGKFIGTSDWAGGGGDDYGFPIQYIHPDIVPQYQGDLEPKDSNDPFVYSFGYDDLAITPWDMLNKKQQQERIKKYGVTGTPYNNSPEPPSLKRKTEDLPLLPFTHPAFNPQIIGNKGQINLPLPSIPNLPYRVEYMGEDSLPTHSYFPSNKEGEAFMNEIQNRPQGISGNVPGGSISGYYDINRMRHTETPKQKLGGRVLPKAQIMGTVPFTTSYTATPSTSKTVVSKTTVADPNSQLIKDYNNPPTTDFDNFMKIQEKAYDTYYQNYNVTNPSYTDPSLNNSTVNLTTGRYKGAKVPTKILDDLIASAQKNNFPIGKLLALAGRESTFGSGDANSKFRRDSQSGLVSGWNVDENYKPYEVERFLADNQVPGVKAHKESDGWWYETTDPTKRDAYLKTHPNLYNRYQKKLNSVKPLGNKNYFDLAIEFLNNKGIKKYNPGDANYINLYNQDYNTLQTDPAIQQYLKSKNVKYKNGGLLDQYQTQGEVTSPIVDEKPYEPYRVDYLNAHTGKRDSKWFEDEESSRYFVKNWAGKLMDASGVTGYYEKPPGKKKPPSPTEQQRLKDQAELKDTTKSFYNQWYNSPMHSQMLKESLRKPFGTGLFLNKRVKNKTQDRLNTINNEMDLNLEPYPEGSFDVSVAGKVKRNRPNLINISPFSTLEGQKGTSIHEGAHVTDLMSGIPRKDIKKMQNYANFNMPFPESLSAGYSPQDQTDFKKYVSKDTETRARVMNGKYVLSQIGSQIQYDPFTQKLNKDQFYKAEQLSPEFKRINDELRSIYSEDEILNLHNTLSKTNNTQPQTMAKYGGPLQSFYEGKMNGPNMFGPGGQTTDGCPANYYKNALGKCVPNVATDDVWNKIKAAQNANLPVRTGTNNAGQNNKNIAASINNTFNTGNISQATNVRTDEKVKGNIRNLNQQANQQAIEDKKQEDIRVKERLAAKDFNEGKTKTFTLPNDETKTLDQMNWRERQYVAGKSLESKGRFFENEESLIDGLNPLNWITGMAGALGEAPYQAKQSGSNMPYVSAILNPLLMGRAMGSTSINPLGKQFWTSDVSNSQFLNNMAGGIPGMTKDLTRGTLNFADRHLSDVGRNLAKIQKEGKAAGLNPFEIAQKQMKKVGITSNQRQAYIPGISDLTNKYVTPFGYEGSAGKTKLSEIIDNIKKGGLDIRSSRYTGHSRQDAWNLYLGMPQKNKTFALSNTSPALHPSYPTGSLEGMDIYNISNMNDYQHVPSFYSDELPEQYLQYLENPITFHRDPDIMGGYNARMSKLGTEYNDIWDLHPGITLRSLFPKVNAENPILAPLFYKNKIINGVQRSTPRGIKIPVDKFIGKPFMSHGINPSATSNAYLKQLGTEIETQIQGLKPKVNISYNGPSRLSKMEQDLENVKNYKLKYAQGGVASNEGYYNKGMGIPKFQTAGNVTNTPPQDPRSQKFYNNLETYFNNSTNPRDHALYESFKKFNSIHGYAPVNINGKTIMGDRAMTNPFTGSLNLINNGDPNDLIDQYMAEYPHYQQYNEHPERSKFRKSAGFLGKVFKDYGTMFKNLDRKKTLSDLGHFRFRKVGEDFTDAYEKNYETPGTSEYQAHKVMEPANWNELERYYKERMAAPRFDDGGAPCPDGYIRNAAGECVLIGSNLNTKSAGDNTRVVNPGMTDQGVLAKDLGNTNNFNKGWMQSPMYHQMITASVAASNNPNDKDIPEVRERLSDPSRIQVVQKDLNNPNKGGETVGLPYTATGPVSKVILNTNTTIPRQEAMDHEILGHATDLNGALIPQPDKEKMDKYFTPQEKIDTSGTDPIKLYADGNGISYADAKKEINEGLKNPEWAKEWNKHVSEMNKLVSQADKTNNARSNEDKYISGSSETRARMMSVRKLAKDNGVYDPFTQKMTRENLRKLKSLNNFELDSLFNNYTEDELLDMFNSISKSNSGQEQTMAKYGGGIHIKPSHVGRFTEYKQRTGKTTEEALHSPDPHVRQMANFARNAAKWKHAEGGQTDMICYDDQGRVRPCGSQDYLNKWLGNPMGRAEKTAEAAGEKWFNPQTKKWESEQMDNFRHPTAGRYTAEAIANKFPSWMQYTPIPKATGFIGSNLLGLGHELIETSDNPDYSLWDKIREGGEDAFNNMVGAGVGSLPFVSDAKKTAMLKYLSDNNLLPDGIGKVDAKKNNGKGNLYKKANGGDISIPQLPQHNSPLLQFYYAKTGGQTPRNIPQSMVNQEKKLKLKYGIKYKL